MAKKKSVPKHPVTKIGSLEELAAHFNISENKETGEQKKTNSPTGRTHADLITRNERAIRNKIAHGQSSDFFEPYTFVDINERVQIAYKEWQDVPNALDIKEDLLSGTVSFQLKVKTPLLFSHNIKEDCAIPASALRGLIRSNLQILGYSSVKRDIEDRNPRIRGLNPARSGIKKAIKNYYYKRIQGEDILIPKGKYSEKPKRKYLGIGESIHGGIITFDIVQHKYYIIPTKYYSIKLQGIRTIKDFHVSYPKIGNIFEAYTSKWGARNRQGSKSFRFPFYKLVTFSASTYGEVTAVSDSAQLPKKGYILSSGYIMNSKTVYLFEVPSPNTERIQLPEESVRNYQRENTNPDPFYQLPLAGESKPVFYLLEPEKNTITFGFTKLFPIPLEKSTCQRLPQGQRITGIDYDQALFGMEGMGNGGRLVFEDAKLSSESKIEDYVISVSIPMLFNPKLQSIESYFDYVGQSDINHMPLMGIKQYWLRTGPITESFGFSEYSSAFPGGKEDQYKADAIAGGTTFFGNIRFYNLSKEELGLLLWSTELNANSEQNLGNHRAYGYGRVKLSINALDVHPTQQGYQAISMKAVRTGNTGRKVYFIKEYQKQLNDFLHGKLDIDKRLQEFFLTRQIPSIAEKEIVSYSPMRWGIQRMQQAPNHVRDVAEKYQWIIVDSIKIEEILKPLNWETLIHHTPKDIAEHPNFSRLLEKYRFLSHRRRLYEKHQEYLIRRDILENVLLFLENAKNNDLNPDKNAGLDELSYDGLDKLWERCLKELQQFEFIFTAMASAFPKSSKPQLSVKCYVREGLITNYLLQIENQAFRAPALILQFRIIDNLEHEVVFDLSEPEYITGGMKMPVSLPKSIFPVNGVHGVGARYHVEIEYTRPIDTFATKEAKAKPSTKRIDLPLVFEGDVSSWENLENPYTPFKSTGEVGQRDMFFGRESIVQKIVNRATNLSNEEFSGKNIVIYGQFRAGKSSILRYVKEELKKYNNCYVIDAGQIVDGQTSMSFIKYILTGVKSSLRIASRFYKDDEVMLSRIKQCKALQVPQLTNDMEDTEIFGLFEQYMDEFSAILQPECRIVLLIDEFSRLHMDIQRAYIPRTIMKFWKAFIQRYRICSILVGADGMKDFVEKFPNEFGTADIFHVTYLEKPAARDLICQPFQKSNHYNGFTEDAIELMWELTAGSAYYLMMFCADIVDYLNERQWEREINASFVQRFLENVWFQEGNPNAFDWSRFHPLYRDEGDLQVEEDNIAILHVIAAGALEDGWCELDKVYRQLAERVPNIENKLDRLNSRDVLYFKQRKLVKIKVQLFAKALLHRYGRESNAS